MRQNSYSYETPRNSSSPSFSRSTLLITHSPPPSNPNRRPATRTTNTPAAICDSSQKAHEFSSSSSMTNLPAEASPTTTTTDRHNATATSSGVRTTTSTGVGTSLTQSRSAAVVPPAVEIGTNPSAELTVGTASALVSNNSAPKRTSEAGLATTIRHTNDVESSTSPGIESDVGKGTMPKKATSSGTESDVVKGKTPNKATATSSAEAISTSGFSTMSLYQNVEQSKKAPFGTFETTLSHSLAPPGLERNPFSLEGEGDTRAANHGTATTPIGGGGMKDISNKENFPTAVTEKNTMSRHRNTSITSLTPLFSRTDSNRSLGSILLERAKRSRDEEVSVSSSNKRMTMMNTHVWELANYRYIRQPCFSIGSVPSQRHITKNRKRIGMSRRIRRIPDVGNPIASPLKHRSAMPIIDRNEPKSKQQATAKSVTWSRGRLEAESRILIDDKLEGRFEYDEPLANTKLVRNMNNEIEHPVRPPHRQGECRKLPKVKEFLGCDKHEGLWYSRNKLQSFNTDAKNRQFIEQHSAEVNRLYLDAQKENNPFYKPIESLIEAKATWTLFYGSSNSNL